MDSTTMKLARITETELGSLIHVHGVWALRATRKRGHDQIEGYLFLTGEHAGAFSDWWDETASVVPTIAPGAWRLEVDADFIEQPRGVGLWLLLTSQGILFRGHDGEQNPVALHFRVDGTEPPATQNRYCFGSWGVVVGAGDSATIIAGPLQQHAR